jgi:hypothetical protein
MWLYDAWLYIYMAAYACGATLIETQVIAVVPYVVLPLVVL